MSSLIREKLEFASSNNINTIRGFILRKQQGPYKAIVQIAHGMTEHYERYEEFMTLLAENGYVAVVYDHLGHKHSVEDKADLGYFAPEDGYKCVLSDMATAAGIVRKMFPQLKLFVMGHSMGSFYTRVFAAKYHYLADGILISGTSGPNPMTEPGLAFIAVMMKLKGERYRSKLAVKLMFGKYLDRIPNPKSTRDWLSRDEEYIQKYRRDEYCSFIFTLSGYRDLISIIKAANSSSCYEHTKKDIPYYMFSGDMDPVGDYGEGVKKVYNSYKNAGVEDITLNLYEGGRHEMLNETNKKEVHRDIIIWLDSKYNQ